MSKRLITAIDVAVFGALLLAGLMIAAGLSHAETLSSATKTDRMASAVEITVPAPATVTVGRTDTGAQTTTLVRVPI